MQARHKSSALGLGIGAFALISDQISKKLVFASLNQHSGHIPLAGPIDFTLVVNRSNAFSVVPIYGDVTRWALIIVSFAVAGFLIFDLIRRPLPRAVAASFGFIMAGALGNAFDRLDYGFVVDFIDAGKLGFHWVFNIADVSIDAGAALFLWSVLKTRRPSSATTP